MVLGGRRADNVKTAIAGEGMTAEKIATTSRASSTQRARQSSWAKIAASTWCSGADSRNDEP